MTPKEFRELVVNAGIVKPDYTKLGKLLKVSPQWARRLCTVHDCTHQDHIQKLEALARERKDAE